jgi:hypothetical protein
MPRFKGKNSLFRDKEVGGVFCDILKGITGYSQGL